MKELHHLNKRARKNNLRLSNWVAKYLDLCLETNSDVTLVTPWCLSKGLEKRYQEQGQTFRPSRQESDLFSVLIPEIQQKFINYDFNVFWSITFNRGFVQSRILNPGLENLYRQMIMNLAQPLVDSGGLLLLDWEEDLLGHTSKPNQEVLDNPDKFISPEILDQELEWAYLWYKNETNIRVIDQKSLTRDIVYQAACEAEEGRFIFENHPFGRDFLIVPLEVPEQFIFFKIFAPDFQQRIVSILPLYPWRVKEV